MDDLASLFKTDYSPALQGLGSLAQVRMEQRRQDLQREEQLRVHAWDELQYRDKLHEHSPELVAKYGPEFVKDMYANSNMRPPSDEELIVRGLEFMRGPNAAAGAGAARMESVGAYPGTGRNAPGSDLGMQTAPGQAPQRSMMDLPPTEDEMMLGLDMKPRKGAKGKPPAGKQTGKSAPGSDLGSLMEGSIDPRARVDARAMSLSDADLGMSPRELGVRKRRAELEGDPALALRSRREADVATADLFGRKIDPGEDDLLEYKVGMTNAQRPRVQPQNPWPAILAAGARDADSKVMALRKEANDMLSKAGIVDTTKQDAILGAIGTQRTRVVNDLTPEQREVVRGIYDMVDEAQQHRDRFLSALDREGKGRGIAPPPKDDKGKSKPAGDRAGVGKSKADQYRRKP